MNNIRSISERARQAGLSDKTLYREIREGRGPATIRLGLRKVGISDEDWHAWIASRRVAPQPVVPVTLKRGRGRPRKVPLASIPGAAEKSDIAGRPGNADAVAPRQR